MIRPSGRNVVLVVLDSARADLFHANTPVFEELSESGKRFDRAIAPAGWTLPSHASMFTGLHPTEHGIIALGTAGGNEANLRNARERVRQLFQQKRLIAPSLRDAGVRTFSATSSPWLWKGSGLDAGFDETDFFYFLGPRYRSLEARGWAKRLNQIYATARTVGQYVSWIRARRDKGAARVLSSMESFVRGSGRPFFAFTNLIETHLPHFPMGTSIRGREIVDLVLQPPLVRFLRMRSHNYGTGHISATTLARWRDAYASEMRYVDRWLADLSEMLARARVADDTAVIVTSDHGENLGEAGLVGHGLSVAEVAAHVPLGMWGAGVSRESVPDPVSLLSLPATLKELITNEPNEDSLLHNGSRGSAVMEIEDPAHVSRPPKRAKRRASGPGAAFYEGSLKLALDPFTGTGLYDLENDPGERDNLFETLAPTERQTAAREAWERRVTRSP
jgi:arylsulfatase A-like enzyme